VRWGAEGCHSGFGEAGRKAELSATADDQRAVSAVTLSDGSRLPCDYVLFATGSSYPAPVKATLHATYRFITRDAPLCFTSSHSSLNPLNVSTRAPCEVAMPPLPCSLAACTLCSTAAAAATAAPSSAKCRVKLVHGVAGGTTR
jgi:hypothetical protein